MSRIQKYQFWVRPKIVPFSIHSMLNSSVDFCGGLNFKISTALIKYVYILNILCILNGTILGCTQNWYFWILLMVRTPWGAYSPKKIFWRWVRLLSRYRLPKWAKMSVRAIFTNKRNFFPRDDLKHSKNQSGPKWPHLSIFSLSVTILQNSRNLALFINPI